MNTTELMFTSPLALVTVVAPALLKVATSLGIAPPVQFVPVLQSDVAPFQFASVAKADLIRRPGTARRAAAQRGNPHLELIAYLKGLAGPAVPEKGGWTLALEAPGLRAAVVLLHDEIDEGVRIDEPELLHGAFEVDLVVPIEHREGMVCKCRHRKQCQRTSRQKHGQSSYHRRLPVRLRRVLSPPMSLCTGTF